MGCKAKWEIIPEGVIQYPEGAPENARQMLQPADFLRSGALQASSVRMNYDEYIQEVEKFADDEVISRLSKRLASWKTCPVR